MKYRQIAHRLRFQMGPGRPDVESERPRQSKTGVYQDIGPDGKSLTVVDVPDDARVNVAALLASGAIEPLPVEKPAKGGKGG